MISPIRSVLIWMPGLIHLLIKELMIMKIGILGCGKIAQVRHIPEYADNPNCEIGRAHV